MTSFKQRKCSSILLIGMCILIPAASVMAQRSYSLQGLMDASKNYLPLFRQKQSLINSAKASVADARHTALPDLRFAEQLNIASDNSLAGTTFGLGVLPSTSGGVRADNNMQAATGNAAVLYGEYELVNFGLNNARVQNAQAYVGLREADLEKEQYLVLTDLAKLYFTILKYQYRLTVDKQNVDRYQQIFTVIRALTGSGLKAGADSSLAKAELSKTRTSYNQTAGRINQLKEQMALYTGIPAKQLLIDTLAIPVSRTRPAPVSFVMDTLNNPILSYYTRKQDTYLANETLIKKSYLPKILLAGSTWARGSSIQFSDTYKSLTTGLGYQRYNYALGVAFTYSLFNGIHKKDKLAINRFDMEASGFELQQQKAALVSAALQADNSLQVTEANLLELPVQLQAAQDTYQQKLAQYKAGIISLIDLTNASFVLYRSQTDYIETLSDWYLAQLDKAASTGNLTQFIQTIK